ncbi:hypothetical protein E3P89_01542 [Wallemia ichthyophaga]|uniref:Uncharacterized protein n=1 Tax=Wallemia ichthyophaga TaxID=245174 RepID=A0A4T0HF81_WALIC|nr:hypothetical protein E3P90_01872 [Wallemia ichthyophaga]TIB14438.1 hypothetical protein E3P93_01622 [Wallemia ichthyophaga]TIB23550.1 hypothetical protein E3P89_01542 [Wallemia ichthyophaga]TIB24899.1 hypothetical protein E3P88_01827 [Wallemia ichthyophaga]
MSSAEDKLREYVDGLDKLEDRLSGIRESVKQLSCYKNVTDAAGRGLNDIEVLKAQTVDLKDAFEYASISEQSNSAGVVDSRPWNTQHTQNKPHTHQSTLKLPKFKYIPSFSHPPLHSHQDVTRLLDSLIPSFPGLGVRYVEHASIGVKLNNGFHALLILSPDKYKATRINIRTSDEGTRQQDHLASQHTLTQQMSAYCSGTVDSFEGSLPFALALLDSYTRTLFTQSCYRCHRLVSPTQLLPPFYNVYTHDDVWITLHADCLKHIQSHLV